MSHPGNHPQYGPPQGYRPPAAAPYPGPPRQVPPQGPPPGHQPYPSQQYADQQYADQQYGARPNGAMPPAPMAPQPTPAQRQRPAEVETAFRLFLANIACSVIGAVLSFMFVGALVDMVLADSGLGSEFASAVRAAAESAGRQQIITQVVASGVGIALMLFFVLQMRNRKNWARIVLTVLGGLSVIGILAIHLRQFGDYFSIGVPGTLYAVLTVVQMLLVAAAIFFMFRPRSNAYFAR